MLTMVATMPMMANTMTMRAMMVPMVVSMMFFDGHFLCFDDCSMICLCVSGCFQVVCINGLN